jgi:serine/threonine protein kinase
MCLHSLVLEDIIVAFVFFLYRLCYLHSEKIVHRDVKTENMLLDKTRTVKIADFGVARVEASNPSDMTGETGTLGYMAPEVFGFNHPSVPNSKHAHLEKLSFIYQ